MENDLLEAIVALPEQLFYNTGIASYVWLLSNRKSEERRGTVQLIDARGLWTKMRKSLGEKRRYLNEEQVPRVTRLHGSLVEDDLVKVVPVEQFGYRTITVDRPLRARWEFGPTTWDGVADDKALAKLDEATRAAVVENLEATAHRTFQNEAGCREILKEIAGREWRREARGANAQGARGALHGP